MPLLHIILPKEYKGSFTKKDLYKNVYNSFFLKSTQKLETTLMSNRRKINYGIFMQWTITDNM